MFPIMQCENRKETFETMAETSKLNSVDEETVSVSVNRDSETQTRLFFSWKKDVNTLVGTTMTNEATLQSVFNDSNSCSMEINDKLSAQAGNSRLKARNGAERNTATPGHELNSEELSEDKENNGFPLATNTADGTEEKGSSDQSKSLQSPCVSPSKQHASTEDSDAEMVRRAQEEGRVHVVFPGTVTQEGCSRFVSEILKCILYQRQQLPMTYDQLVYSQKKQQATVQEKNTVRRRPGQIGDFDWHKCQQTLQDLEEVLQQLEVLFSLSRVPRVLLLLGGSVILPKELYEINMEALVVAGGDQCLRVSSCLRQLFRTLFVADLLSDSRPVRLMPTTILALAHRDCGVEWFRPKLQFKVPTRVKNQVISLSTDPSSHNKRTSERYEWKDYVWFQAPMAIKGFGK